MQGGETPHGDVKSRCRNSAPCRRCRCEQLLSMRKAKRGQAKGAGSGHAPYIYHSIRPGWEQSCGSAAQPLSCTVPTCSSAEMPRHVPGEGLLQGCAPWMEGATTGTILQCWACSMSPRLGQQACSSGSPLHGERVGGSQEVVRTPRVKGLVAQRQPRSSGVPLSCGEVWLRFRYQQSPATPKHLVFGVAPLCTAASRIHVPKHTCNWSPLICGPGWSKVSGHHLPPRLHPVGAAEHL